MFKSADGDTAAKNVVHECLSLTQQSSEYSPGLTAMVTVKSKKGVRICGKG